MIAPRSPVTIAAEHLTHALETLSIVRASLDEKEASMRKAKTEQTLDDQDAAELHDALGHILEAEALLRGGDVSAPSVGGEGDAWGLF